MKYILYFIFAGFTFQQEGTATVERYPNMLRVRCANAEQVDNYYWVIVEQRGDSLLLDDGSIAFETANAVEIRDSTFHLSIYKDENRD